MRESGFQVRVSLLFGRARLMPGVSRNGKTVVQIAPAEYPERHIRAHVIRASVGRCELVIGQLMRAASRYATLRRCDARAFRKRFIIREEFVDFGGHKEDC